jgi:hypothetical protein
VSIDEFGSVLQAELGVHRVAREAPDISWNCIVIKKNSPRMCIVVIKVRHSFDVLSHDILNVIRVPYEDTN